MLTNKIAYIRLFVPDDALKVWPPIDETELVKKRQAEGELKAERNPSKRPKSTSFSGRATSTTPRGGNSTRGRGPVQRGGGGNRGGSRGGSRDVSRGGYNSSPRAWCGGAAQLSSGRRHSVCHLAEDAARRLAGYAGAARLSSGRCAS